MENRSTRSTTAVSQALQAEIGAQLQSAMIALRDQLFELQDMVLRLKDVAYDLHALVQKIEVMMVPPAIENGHGQ